MKFRNAFFLLGPLVFVAFGFYTKHQDLGEDILLRAINMNLQNAHYDPIAIDDDFSEKAFQLYIDNLDANKRLFLQSDIDELNYFKTTIDDEIINGTSVFFDKSIELLEQRTELTEQFFEEILNNPMDFSKDEMVDFGEEIPYTISEKELKDRWRKYLKYSVLTRLYSDYKAQEKSLENKDTTFIPKSMDSLQTIARKSVLKTHRDWYKRIKRLDRKDRLAIYANSITTVYDPHTNYFPPEQKEDFDIQMSGRLEGIGAQLQEKDGYIKITNIIPGGPSSLQGELQANDLILKVTQEGEEPVEIIDWRISDAVKIIRGPKGSKVTLTVRKPDGNEQDITITRDIVVLEETYAKSLLLSDEDGIKAGYIYLPSFYADFQNPKGRFSWKDVKTEIEKLRDEQVQGIILDLRNNGGGSLDDVVKMGGLFIDKGPIVQVKEKGRSAHILEDRYAGAEWEGALVIMVNEFSASASEIMAAAMQDYDRAIIIGSRSTHGKGTVQRFLPLNRTLRNKNIPDIGSIKLTIQKFYRINGDATQLKGVQSDVIIPDNYMYLETGEQEHDYPLPWDQIKGSSFEKNSHSISDKIIKKSQSRINKNATFNLIEENAKRWEKQRENSTYALNFSAYTNAKLKEKEEGEKFEKIGKEKIENFNVSNPGVDIEVIEAEESRKKRNSDWVNSVSKNPYIY